MEKEQQKLNSSISTFTRLIIGLPVIAYFITNQITVTHYGAHDYYFYSFIYAILYYWDDPSNIMVINYLIMLFSVLFPCFTLLPNKKASSRYGSAQIAQPEHINKMIKKKSINHDTGIILGKESSKKNAKLYRYDRPLATLVLAPAGTGKTTAIAIPNVLGLDNQSLIIHDPKGELCEASIKHRENFSQCHVFNFALDGSAVFNPLCKTIIPTDHRRYRSYVDNIATVIFGGNTDDYWTTASANIFRFFALYDLYMDGTSSLPAIYKATKGDKSLRQIIYKRMGLSSRGKELVEDKQNKEVIIPADDDNPFLMASDNNTVTQSNDTALNDAVKKFPILEELANSLLQICSSEKQLAGVLGTFDTRMSLFADPIVDANTSGLNQLPILEMRKELHTVYLIVSDEDKDRLRPIVSLMLEFMAKKLISKMPLEEKFSKPTLAERVKTIGGLLYKPVLIQEADNRITFILDEFVRLRGIDTLKSLPEIGRGYNLASIYIAQDYDQVEEAFGKAMRGKLKTLFAYKVIFRQNNDDTAEFIAKSIGQFTDIRESWQENKNKVADEGNVSMSYEGLQLITAQDIMNLPDDECIITVEGFAKLPIKAKTSSFFNTKQFSNLFNQYKIDNYETLLGADE
jgi:type IV secretion system protein VirD4